MDLLHAGHILMLQECHTQCDHLIVGLHTDPSVDRPHKNKPIQSFEERYTQLAACRHVDEIVTYDTEADLEALIERLRPDVRFLGADWQGKDFTGRALCDRLGIQVCFNSRDHSYSSSNLRERVYWAEALRRGK
jgi:glycerol-3-phosphate cytidylyltransferase